MKELQAMQKMGLVSENSFSSMNLDSLEMGEYGASKTISSLHQSLELSSLYFSSVLIWSLLFLTLRNKKVWCEIFKSASPRVLTVHRSAEHREAESGKQLARSVIFMGFCKIVCQKWPSQKKMLRKMSFEHRLCRNQVVVDAFCLLQKVEHAAMQVENRGASRDISWKKERGVIWELRQA